MHEPDRTEPFTASSLPEAPIRILAPGTRIGERYEVRSVLGSGGFAVVYRAFDRELRRDVALKVLRADRLSPSSLRRLRREAAIARDAASPRLVRIFDIGSSEQAIYLTMEVVGGESLRERLSRGPLSVPEAVRIAAQVLEGLAALHALGIVHRDVKPGNILLTGDGEVKLADFGLALEWEGDETRTVGDGVVGTLDYVSPEQALGEEADPRSDLYSLGVVLFEMLAGQLPYQERSALGSLLGRLHKPVPDVRRLRPEVPRWLADVVERLLGKDPARRHPSAAAVLTDLRPRSVLRTRGWWLRLARIAGPLILVLAVLAGAVLIWRTQHRLRFDKLVELPGGSGVQALDADGKVLWKIPGVALWRCFALARLAPGVPSRLVAILRSPTVFDPEHTNILTVLDPDTGQILHRVKLPSAAERFPGFSRQYGPQLLVADLDQDGLDEVIVSFNHSPFWPSYTVLYEPRIERTRVVFSASGHHLFAGARDLDGDGHAELIFSGINNRMGWFSAVAAVRVVPWVNETVPGQDHLQSASSPDEASPPGNGTLLWYALAPRSSPDPVGQLTMLPSKKAFLVHYQGAPSVEVGFDGFLTGPPASLPSSRRQSYRKVAYDQLREANRLLQAEFPREALGQCESALHAAERAEDARLVEWISRVRGMILIAAGRFEEADKAFRELSIQPGSSASEIAFDAGRAFHLKGDLQRAISWYRQGLGPGGSSEAGRGKYEFLEGAVLALGELRQWDDGLSEITRFAATYPSENVADFYREYLRWRSGETPREEGLDRNPSTDLLRYWSLEFRLAHREVAEVLLHEVEREDRRSSETQELLLSLKGEVLARLGQREEALGIAQDALRQTRAHLRTSTLARAHFDLVTERFARLAREAGRPDEATAALDQLRRWRSEVRKAAGS